VLNEKINEMDNECINIQDKIDKIEENIKELEIENEKSEELQKNEIEKAREEFDEIANDIIDIDEELNE
jgi:uncharacterized coiled-coil DUF342 family protein